MIWHWWQLYWAVFSWCQLIFVTYSCGYILISWISICFIMHTWCSLLIIIFWSTFSATNHPYPYHSVIAGTPTSTLQVKMESHIIFKLWFEWNHMMYVLINLLTLRCPDANTPVFLNTLRPRQNGHHFADDVFKCIFLNENVLISLKISLKFVPQVPINNIPA